MTPKTKLPVTTRTVTFKDKEENMNILDQSIVDQCYQATLKQNRIAMYIGAVLGGVIPLATYSVAHIEAEKVPTMWILVTSGLIYSAMTVYDWAKKAFKHPMKAIGFVVLLEGVMTFSTTSFTVPFTENTQFHWLSLLCLVLLMGINAVSAGCQLSLDRKITNQKKQ